jgi:hypothetical protein
VDIEGVGELVKGAVEEKLASDLEFEGARIATLATTPNEANLRLSLANGAQYDVVITKAETVAAGRGG